MNRAQLARDLLTRFGGGRCCPHHNHGDGGHFAAKRLAAQGTSNTDYAFEMVCATLRFGRGVTAEVGHDLQHLGAKHTLVVTDKNVANTMAFKNVERSLKSQEIRFTVFDDVKIEPTDASMQKAIDFAKSANVDSFVAVGGGSVIDTTKAAALYTSNAQAEFLDFVGPPFGKGLVAKNPMLPLIAVPTTAGTGSETTGAAIMDLPEKQCKAGIRQRCIKPMLAIIDPLNVVSMPRNVAIYSGFDVLCHALESFTALPYHMRPPRPLTPNLRPLYQGSNPISDVWAREALSILHKYFRRSVFDAGDEEARTAMLSAASFAGMGFGNAGVHIAHGLSYPISSQGKKYQDVDYPSEKKLIPHGLSVVTTAAADFEFTSAAFPEKHREAARLLGADVPDNASTDYIGRTLGDQLRSFMSDFKVPNGLSAMGFTRNDVDSLTAAALNSVTNIVISPRETDKATIANIYEKSLHVY